MHTWPPVATTRRQGPYYVRWNAIATPAAMVLGDDTGIAATTQVCSGAALQCPHVHHVRPSPRSTLPSVGKFTLIHLQKLVCTDHLLPRRLHPRTHIQAWLLCRVL